MLKRWPESLNTMIVLNYSGFVEMVAFDGF